MAGGTWMSQTKVLPGVYINVKSQPNITANVGERGVVAIPKALSWGAPGEVTEYTPGEDTTRLIGYPITDSHARFLAEMIKGTDVSSCPKKVLIYRYAGATTEGVAATAAGSVSDGNGGTMTYELTAKYPGIIGNKVTVVGENDPISGQYKMTAYLDGQEVYYYDYIGSTTIGQTQGVGQLPFTATLSGGADPVTSEADDAAAMTALESYTWDVLCYDGTTALTISAYKAFVTRMNNDIGRKCQLVVGNTTGLNTPYAISARNGVKLNDGTVLTAEQATWWLAGAEAGANYNQSLTYAQYPGAVGTDPKLTSDQISAGVRAGQIVFIDDFDTVKICTDINTKRTVTVDEGAEFKKNRVIRVISTFCNDVYEHFSTYFIGKVDNNDSGRALLRAWIIGYLNEMQANNGVQNFIAEDVEVLPGNEIDAVVINVAIQPTDSVEKVYVSVTVSVNASVTG